MSPEEKTAMILKDIDEQIEDYRQFMMGTKSKRILEKTSDIIEGLLSAKTIVEYWNPR